MNTKTYQLETLTCPSCVARIEKVVGKVEGVSEVEVLFNSSRVKVEYDGEVVDNKRIEDTIEDLGYKILGGK